MRSLLKILLCSCLCCDFCSVDARTASSKMKTQTDAPERVLNKEKQQQKIKATDQNNSQSSNITENEAAKVKSLVEGTANASIQSISNSIPDSDSDPQKKAKELQLKKELKAIITRDFDIERICTGVLGANRRELKALDTNENDTKAWKAAHDGLGYYESFISLTKNMLVSYFCLLLKKGTQAYKKEQLKKVTLSITKIHKVHKDGNIFTVSSVLKFPDNISPQPPKIEINWLVSINSNGRYYVENVSSQGLSVKNTVREGVSGMISTNKNLKAFMNAFWEKYHQL